MKTDLTEDIKEVKADIKTLDKRFQNLEKQIVLIKWMLGAVIVAVVIPILLSKHQHSKNSRKSPQVHNNYPLD